jgi:hypothetical protein
MQALMPAKIHAVLHHVKIKDAAALAAGEAME